MKIRDQQEPDRDRPDQGKTSDTAPTRMLSPAAQRALREAAERRAEIDARSMNRPKESSGRPGPDPARYGDWENKGIASDF